MHDTLTFNHSPSVSSSFKLECTDPRIPVDDSNILTRVYRHFQDRISGAIEIYLEKIIPTGGGLGGGSSNAAAFLLYLNHTFEWGYSLEELETIGITFGSDVPFFLSGGRALVSGIGESVRPLAPSQPVFFVLITPSISISTKQAYQWLDESCCFAKKSGSIDSKFNSFKSVVFSKTPLFSDIENCLIQLGAPELRLSGTGSTLFLTCESLKKAQFWKKQCQTYFPAHPIEVYAPVQKGSTWEIEPSGF